MTILALEFSSERRSVALARGGMVLSEAVQQTRGHGTNAFGLTEKVLAEAKIAREEIAAIAVGLGPGSYTGIRAAIAMAQGWQLARGVKLLGVSSAEALAAQAQAENFLGRVTVAIDAQRNEFYLATWEISETTRSEIEPLRIVPAAEIQPRGNEVVVGPDAERWLSNGRTLYPSAGALAELAARRINFVPGEKLQPIYLRETTFVKTARTPTVPG